MKGAFFECESTVDISLADFEVWIKSERPLKTLAMKLYNNLWRRAIAEVTCTPFGCNKPKRSFSNDRLEEILE